MAELEASGSATSDVGTSEVGASDVGTSDVGAGVLPLGTYADCARGVHGADGNDFLNTSGFEQDARLTLSRDGSTLMATYLDEGGHLSTFALTPLGPTVATLGPPGQVATGFMGMCVLGPGKETFQRANVSLEHGALHYDAGTIFLSLQGVLREIEASECGMRSTPAQVWIACARGELGTVSTSTVDEGAPATLAPSADGAYACTSQVATHDVHAGTSEYVTAGASGTLTLSRTGSEVSARYDGDTYLAGTTHFVATSPTTAHAETDQTLSAPCVVPVDATGVTIGPPEPLSLAAASLTLHDTTLVVSFAGTMTSNTDAPSTCPSARKTGALFCEKR